MRLPILPCLFLTAAAASGADTVVEDFAPDAARKPIVFQDADHGTATIAIASAPGSEQGQALVVEWHDWRKGYIDWSFGRLSALPDLVGGSGTLSVRVHLPERTTLRSAALRLVDAGGEVYQWPAAGDLGGTGWRTLVVAVSPTTSSGHWGGDGNGKIDLPLRLQGFAITPQAIEPSGGGVALGAITSAGNP